MFLLPLPPCHQLFHINHGFSFDLVKPLYFYNSYLCISRPPLWFDYTANPKKELKAVQEASTTGLLSTNILPYYIPELTLNKLQEYLRSAACNFHNYMPIPDSSLLIIYDQTITSIGDLRQAYHQLFNAEEQIL